MDDKISATDSVAANLVRGGPMPEAMQAFGVYHVECIGTDGHVKWRDVAPNLVTNQGKQAMLDKFLDRATAYAACTMGLHTAVGTATSTYASPGSQTESVVYSEANRPPIVFSAATNATTSVKATNPTATAFSINGSATIAGCFLALGAAGISTKGDIAASAVLFSSGTFSGGSRAVISGDTLNVTYTMSLT